MQAFIFSYTAMKQHGAGAKLLGILRILLGIGILYYAGMKIFVGAGMEPISAAVAQFGLDALFGANIWFWIVAITELLGGVLLLLGHRTKFGALLVLIIMAVAIATVGPKWNNVSFAVVSVLLLIAGSGARTICRCKKCATNDDGLDMQQQQQ